LVNTQLDSMNMYTENRTCHNSIECYINFQCFRTLFFRLRFMKNNKLWYTNLRCLSYIYSECRKLFPFTICQSLIYPEHCFDFCLNMTITQMYQ